MKQSRLVFATVVVAALCAWSAMALACDKGKTSASAAASNGTCTAAMAAKCTPEMAAACKAKGASATTAAMNGECPYASSSAKGACPHGTSATTASMNAACAAHGTSATTASMKGSCSMHGATATAATAATTGGCCEKGAKGVSASAAGASGSCAAHGSATASAMPAGASCGTHGATAARTAKATDCDACADMAMCADDAKSLGANVSIVPLKNGVMFVYTAEQPGRVQAVQAEMSRRNDHIAAVLAAGDKAKLCPDCKLLRGAIASGKLSRELVNIEGGCLTLMTSTDPAMVAKLHTMAGVKGQSRLAKS